MLDEGLNPAVLNMASAYRPGGGVLNGARAQEECIFRRSNLFMSLYRYDRQVYDLVIEPNRDDFTDDLYDLSFIQQGYPMDENFGGIYSDDVTVFKDGNYEWLHNPYQTAFISVAAMNINRALRQGEQILVDGRLSERAVAITKNKIVPSIALVFFMVTTPSCLEHGDVAPLVIHQNRWHSSSLMC